MRKRTIVLAIGATLALLVGLQVAAFASHPVVTLAGSNFEIDTDANLKVDDTGNQDWANVAENRQPDDPTGQNDRSFGQGSKEDTAEPKVVTGGIPPNKSDLKFFGVYQEGTTNSGFLNLFWSRVQDPSGTTNMDFEFNRLQCTPNLTPADPDCSANGLTPKRTEGDLLITYDLSQGGTVATISFRKWQANGSWGQPEDLTGKAVGTINTSTIPATESDGLGAQDPRTFGEAQIALSAIFPQGTCASFGSAYLKSRSSDSFTAALKDFVPPADVNIANCGNILIDKVTDPSGDETSFPFTLTGGPSQLNQSFNLKDADPKHDSGLVQAGSGYSAAETPVPPSWDLTSATCDDGSPVTNIDVSVGETVTCTFTNTKHTTDLSSEQRYTPQDKAIIGGTGGEFSGKIDFELYKGTSCTGTPVYFERNVTVTLPASGGDVTTTNGAAASADHSAQYDINVGNQGDYRWNVRYYNDANHPETSTCVEASNVTIDNDNTKP